MPKSPKTVPLKRLHDMEKDRHRTYFAMLAYSQSMNGRKCYQRFKRAGAIVDLITHHALSGRELMSPIVVAWDSSVSTKSNGVLVSYKIPDVQDAWKWADEQSRKWVSAKDQESQNYQELAVRVGVLLRNAAVEPKKEKAEK